MSQMVAQTPTATFAECVAVSASADPLGPWYVSEVPRNIKPVMGDYPKFGVWPDAYYMHVINVDFSVNPQGQITSTSSVAFERDQMLQGHPYRLIVATLDADEF